MWPLWVHKNSINIGLACYGTGLSRDWGLQHIEQVSEDNDEWGLPKLLLVLYALQESRKKEGEYLEDQKQEFEHGMVG